jgi:hypothetical protein
MTFKRLHEMFLKIINLIKLHRKQTNVLFALQFFFKKMCIINSYKIIHKIIINITVKKIEFYLKIMI